MLFCAAGIRFNGLRYSAEVENIEVAKKTLDDYNLRNVGFIKIDVEGHELAVLKGAIATLRREQPNFLVEIEEQHRHGAVQAVFGFFEQAGYTGFFLEDGARKPLSAFDLSLHQKLENLDPRGAKRALYINNFAFTPR